MMTPPPPRRYRLSCRERNARHTRFTVFDGAGANCGQITILTADAARFFATAWKGDVAWNGLEGQQ